MHIPQVIYTISPGKLFTETRVTWSVPPSGLPEVYPAYTLMFTCTCDFIFVHKRLLPEIYPETDPRRCLSSLISSASHHTRHTPGALNYLGSENCTLTVLFCLQALSAWHARFLTDSYPHIRKQRVRKAFPHNILVWGFSLS